MSFLGVLLLIVQIAFAVHVVRTGRETYWIFIIMFIPGLGCLLYFLTQVLPDLRDNGGVRRARKRLLQTVDPERELRRRKQELELADTADNRLKLAEECIEADMPAEAVSLLEACLVGAQLHDPYILEALAQAQFRSGDHQAAKDTLDRLIAHNPDFRSHDAHLLYARSLEKLGLAEQATNEYMVLADSYPGEEARVRYGLLLKQLKRTDEAADLFRESLLRAKRAPRYYRNKEKQWLNLAQQNLAE